MLLNRQQFLSIAGMNHEMLSICLGEAWLIPGGSVADQVFSDIDIARARLICDLQVDLGVNHEGIGVILCLIDQLYSMRDGRIGFRGPNPVNQGLTQKHVSLASAIGVQS